MSDRPRSRVAGPRRVLSELRRIRVKASRTSACRQLTAEETRWMAATIDQIDRLIFTGDAVLPGLPDPRPFRRARKRRLELF